MTTHACWSQDSQTSIWFLSPRKNPKRSRQAAGTDLSKPVKSSCLHLPMFCCFRYWKLRTYGIRTLAHQLIFLLQIWEVFPSEDKQTRFLGFLKLFVSFYFFNHFTANCYFSLFMDICYYINIKSSYNFI